MAFPALTPPVPSPLRRQVADILRDAITNGLFEPGGRMTERSLCESLDVSRSTVRESLRQLEAEGLVCIYPNRGPVVAELDDSEAREIYEIRSKLQALASASCARRRSPQLLAGLETALAEMRRAAETGDFPALQAARTEFYNWIFDGSGNRQLAILLKQFRARMTLMRGLGGLRRERMQEAVRGASEILAAVAAGDEAAAAEASEAHIGRAAALVFAAAAQAAAAEQGGTEEGRPA